MIFQSKKGREAIGNDIDIFFNLLKQIDYKIVNCERRRKPYEIEIAIAP